jgi:class 3 adenylate cyclase
LSASPAEASRDDVVRDEALPVEKARKIVTVLVCDAVESQKVWHGLDPEALERAETRYIDAVSGVVERHGGTVEHFAGDAVTAVFGIPQLHEDDALRALRAALDLPQAVADVGLRIRIGVDTGEAIAGGKRLVAGNVIAAAARLQKLADPGEVLIGDETHRLVAHTVRSRLLEPAGGQPLTAWRLLGLGGGHGRVAAPFVGRGLELEALRAALTRAAEQRRCEVCTIAGPPGIGKSRLAGRFLETIRGETTVLVGRCLSYGEGITYWPLREIVRELADDEPRTWIEARLQGDPNAAGVAERIASALGAGAGGAKTTETFWAFRKLFEALATERPLVLAIDDIHWAEPTLLELFEHLAGFSGSAPILLLCLARPELFEKRAEWLVPHENRTVLSLQPLRDVESRALVKRLARAQELPEQARARAVEAAEGNPLFLEQLVAHESDGASDLMPPTIHALLAARIDRLDPGERSVLERAAIGGRTFESEAVGELLPDDQVGKLSERLRAKGDAWFLCGVAAELADILWLQERDDEALELTHLSEELVAEDVLVAQMMWRGARAKVLARRGRGEEAEGLAREGVAIIEATEHVLYHADALSDLAEVLRLRDRVDEAVATAEQARILYEQKGSTAAARKLQAFILCCTPGL